MVKFDQATRQYRYGSPPTWGRGGGVAAADDQRREAATSHSGWVVVFRQLPARAQSAEFEVGSYWWVNQDG